MAHPEKGATRARLVFAVEFKRVVLDLVPLGHPRRVMADGDVEPGLVCKFGKLELP
jgi:hypothetical protein